MNYIPNPQRYKGMTYNRVGRSGLFLPAISLGLWHNFGQDDDQVIARQLICGAFDAGITHFDLANNYGPPPGSAEENFGRILSSDLSAHRDELVVSTKAGYYMWPGPYGDFGSRKYLISSLDQSLKRLRLDYVDIFYHHRPDPETPMEETMMALDQVVRQGKALYVGLSSYSAEQTREAEAILRKLGTPCLIHQPKYSMFDRWVEDGLLDTLEELGIGCITFSSLAQGVLTDRYLKGIPSGSRASKPSGFLKPEELTSKVMEQVSKLNVLASERGQTLAQMALAWVMKDHRISSVIVGASSLEQLENNLESLKMPQFTSDELGQINKILNQ